MVDLVQGRGSREKERGFICEKEEFFNHWGGGEGERRRVQDLPHLTCSRVEWLLSALEQKQNAPALLVSPSLKVHRSLSQIMPQICCYYLGGGA